MVRLPGHESGKPGAPALYQVKPGMFAQSGMGVGLAGGRQQFGHRRQVFIVEGPL
jgi:hypothetical protein